MLATLAFVVGIIIAGMVLFATRTRKPMPLEPSTRPTTLGWSTLVLGCIAAVALAIGATNTISGIGIHLISIACSFAAVGIGIGAILRSDRHWPTWIGFIAGLLPALTWIVFAAGNILGFGG